MSTTVAVPPQAAQLVKDLLLLAFERFDQLTVEREHYRPKQESIGADYVLEADATHATLNRYAHVRATFRKSDWDGYETGVCLADHLFNRYLRSELDQLIAKLDGSPYPLLFKSLPQVAPIGGVCEIGIHNGVVLRLTYLYDLERAEHSVHYEIQYGLRKGMTLTEQDKAVIQLAGTIENQEMLDRILSQTHPDMRAGVFARIRPHLKFEPANDNQDCPRCGRYNGKILSHECLVD